MNAQLLVCLVLPAVGAVIAWLCARGYYRAAYGDRYERGYADGQEAQIRAYKGAGVCLRCWREGRAQPAALPPEAARDARSAAQDVRVLGSWYPLASGPPRYADLAPEQLDDDPPTSEWARDLIADVETWNVAHLGNGGPPWHD